MNPFELLGVDADADERTIKRAYAQKLKVTRPDEHPEAFQQLHDAYQFALRARRGEVVAQPRTPSERPPERSVAELPERVPEASQAPTEQEFGFAAFLSELLTFDRAHSAYELRLWLEQRVDLYSITVKNAAGAQLASLLLVTGLMELSEPALVIVGRFFDFDAESVTGRRRVLRAIASEDSTDFGTRSRAPLRQLKRAFWWPQAFFAAMIPGRAARISGLLSTLKVAWRGVPPGLDQQQVEFFSQLGNPRYFGNRVWALLVAHLVLMLVFGVLPWVALAELLSHDVNIVVGLLGVAGALTALLPAALLLVNCVWLLKRVWFWLRDVPRTALWVRVLPVAFGFAAPWLNANFRAHADAVWLASALLALHWWRVFSTGLLLGTCAFMISYLQPAGSPVQPLAIACTIVPPLVALIDVVYAQWHRVPFRDAYRNLWVPLVALCAVPLMFVSLFFV